MKKHFIAVCCSLFMASQLYAQPLYKNPKAPVKDRISNLISLMTLNEKIGQLCCPLGWEMYTKTDKGVIPSDLFKTQMQNKPIGSYWATLRADPWTRKTLITGLSPKQAAEAINALQKYAVKETRLGIPILFAEECAHGHMGIGTTVFSTSLGQASTWNPELIEEMGKVIAMECRLQGGNIGYGPILDLAREPRWSRMEETFGEDPVLIGVLGSAFVKGLQAKDQNGKAQFYSTLKHFAGYGIPQGGHNGGRAQIGQRELFSEHLAPFKMAVKAGAETVMTSYNSIDGIPSTSNSYLLKDILRNEWGFKGFVYSDLGSIEGVAGHRVAANVKEAAAKSLQAGTDMDLGGNAYGKNLEKALQENLISMADIDSAVSHVLRLKFEAGLFENPYMNPKDAAKIVRCDKHQSVAKEVAREGIVLLKNNQILPLDKSIKSIAVVGPNADNIYNQLGDYTAPQERSNIKTVLDGIKKIVSPETQVNYAKGCAIRDTSESDIASAVEAAKKSEVVVLVLGGSSARDFSTEYKETGAATVSDKKKEVLSDMECGEGYDRSSLDLLGDQEILLQAMIETGKPLVVVYIEGRPLNMNTASEKAGALLTAWYPGQEGGTAIAEVLFGDYNPAGRLPVSIPRSVGQLPVYYSLGEQNSYVEGPSTPLYSFGYGLSYTTFEYSNLKIEQSGKDTFNVSCEVKNSGNREGDEVVQLYLRDNVASVSTPEIQLKKFSRIHLDKGETKKVEFTLNREDLSLYNQRMEFVAEPGTFTVMVGAASNKILLKDKFELK